MNVIDILEFISIAVTCKLYTFTPLPHPLVHLAGGLIQHYILPAWLFRNQRFQYH